MKKDIGITKGEWWVNDCTSNGVRGFEVCWSLDAECVTDHVYTQEDAELIADAGNTAQQCGLLPSELLKQRDELLDVLKECECQLNYLNGKFGETGTTNAMLAKINNATK